MKNYTKEQILHMVEEEDVEFIRLQFTDMFGVLKNIAIPVSRLMKALDNQCVINGDYIDGLGNSEENEYYLYPDLSTFTILPWRPQQGKVARFICDIYHMDGRLCESSPRSILKKVMARAKEMGYEICVRPECEFFLFHTDDNGMPTNITHEKAGYMDTTPLDLGENARRDIILTLEDMGYDIDSSRHELAPAQHEIDFLYSDMLETADKIMTFKVAARTVAKRHGLHATFMPKPSADVDGSGMHIHMKLIKNGKNVFTDPSDSRGLSKDAYGFIAGLMKHIKGMSAISNPLVNSYKRLVTGFEAPYNIIWSCRQNGALLHACHKNNGDTALELRSPDGAANPYLLFALCLAAGLEGIEKDLQAPGDINVDVRKMSREEKKKAGIDSLPANLSVALAEMEKDELIRAVLGNGFVDEYLEKKEQEWESYMEQISEWELSQYLYCM
ncbi:glutamine synthetase family protein [Catenibacillus scindens]|uniref:glutamine synthetase family protein n=1 Tax=Catenibacillus scindens TaxID=673271 RepID=UPI003207C8FA